MNSSLDASRVSLRWTVYLLLILTSTGAMLGRIATIESARGESPLLSANDRSRWCTVRALVDHGTYIIDDVILVDGKKRDREWYTIDLVRHKGHDGREHYYSSKPPLFSTLLAGKYWLLQKLTGATLAEQTFYVVRVLLITTNVLPLVLSFFLLASLIEKYGTTDWGRLFVMAAATWGTFLTTFAVTINNHLPAAVSALLTLCALLPVWYDGERRLRYFAMAGFFAALAAANELPALSLLAFSGAALFWKSPSRTLAGFVPAAAVVAAGFFLTNYWAHDSWRPPYAHRKDGPQLVTLEPSDQQQLDRGEVPQRLRSRLASEQGMDISEQAVILPKTPDQRWVLWDPDGHDRLAIVRSDDALHVHAWDNWYEYENSYWTPEKKQGVDRGEPSRAVYAFHVLVGHHGLFSLTPIWLLSAAGLLLWLRRGPQHLPAVAALIGLLTLICLAFYLSRPLADRNYGGVTSGFRWMFWFTPLWLFTLLPAADRLAHSRPGRTVALLLLLISVFSAAYANLNPWSHPWLFNYWTYLEWLTP